MPVFTSLVISYLIEYVSHFVEDELEKVLKNATDTVIDFVREKNCVVFIIHEKDIVFYDFSLITLMDLKGVDDYSLDVTGNKILLVVDKQYQGVIESELQINEIQCILK